MNAPDAGRRVDEVLRALQERAKELNCLYTVEEILKSQDRPLGETFRAIVEAIPPGWQHPRVCRAKLVLRNLTVHPPEFSETPWVQSAPIRVQGEVVGSISVYYTEGMPAADEGPFLKEERRLIDTIAERLGQFLLHRDLAQFFGGPQPRRAAGGETTQGDWSVVLNLIRRTDANLYRRLGRKMLNHLAFNGIAEAQALLLNSSGGAARPQEASDENAPSPPEPPSDPDATARDAFRIAAERLGEEAALSAIQIWIREDRVGFLLQTLEGSTSTLVEIANAMERYRHVGVAARELSVATQVGLKVSLIRRLLTDRLEFINACRDHVDVEDFFDLLQHVVVLPNSYGRLGGKASGLFLGGQVLRRSQDIAGSVKVPRTWHVPSDAMVRFFTFNDLDDLYNWKYRDLAQIRQEYPHILHVFKSSRFPPEVVTGLSMALDDLGERPIIVRSSSLLEDRVGSAFSGKYKSLFLVNQGSKQARLAALLDAVAEVYASVFSPDPIEYRAERGLLDQNEEMAVMIQEVVGTRVGRYFLPAFSGVGFSNNELRWSPRIRRDDGLLRLVPGLGTRAVDRVADDYPVLVAPGQPGLRVNVTPEEVLRYSPKNVDLLNLESNAFETVPLDRLVREVGSAYPALGQLASRFDPYGPRRPAGPEVEAAREPLVFTFDGLFEHTPFLVHMRGILRALADALGTPVDVEFASDGSSLYLLQCRPQSNTPEDTPTPIPRNVPPSRIVFSAHRYVTNGRLPDLTHMVYVDPAAYARIPDLPGLRAVGRAVGALNRAPPRRRFALLGPGRWGSRGDVRLGVSVTYADINNTAVLIEIARRQGGYVPDLSFGTHFFQDLVESSIRYLPLYPDEEGVAFNEEFLTGAPNALPRLLPEHRSLAEVVRVIDVAEATGGQLLRIVMNAELDEALGFLVAPGS
jgi:pyruvate, water dikinase